MTERFFVGLGRLSRGAWVHIKTKFWLPIEFACANNFSIKRLKAILCLTIVVLLGSMGMSAIAMVSAASKHETGRELGI